MLPSLALGNREGNLRIGERRGPCWLSAGPLSHPAKAETALALWDSESGEGHRYRTNNDNGTLYSSPQEKHTGSCEGNGGEGFGLGVKEGFLREET